MVLERNDRVFVSFFLMGKMKKDEKSRRHNSLPRLARALSKTFYSECKTCLSRMASEQLVERLVRLSRLDFDEVLAIVE
jgi:hypothetical protein